MRFSSVRFVAKGRCGQEIPRKIPKKHQEYQATPPVVEPLKVVKISFMAFLPRENTLGKFAWTIPTAHLLRHC
jgi:hypothetical protein